MTPFGKVGTFCSTTIGLPEPLIVTFTVTLVSSLSPPLVTETSSEGAGVIGISTA